MSLRGGIEDDNEIEQAHAHQPVERSSLMCIADCVARTAPRATAIKSNVNALQLQYVAMRDVAHRAAQWRAKLALDRFTANS